MKKITRRTKKTRRKSTMTKKYKDMTQEEVKDLLSEKAENCMN